MAVNLPEMDVLPDVKKNISSKLNTSLGNVTDVSEIAEYRPMLNYIKNLFDSPEFCDVTLITSGIKTQAHKLILTSRSPVFAAMFKSNMKDKKDNEFDIDGMDYEVLREMLRFIYTGTTTKLEEMADRLLAAAHKYELETLKHLCEKQLCKNIKVDNAADLLILADLHGVSTLKKYALNFFCTNTDEVTMTPKYQSMHTSHPQLLDEAFRTLAKKYSLPTFGFSQLPSESGAANNKDKYTSVSEEQFLRATPPEMVFGSALPWNNRL